LNEQAVLDVLRKCVNNRKVLTLQCVYLIFSKKEDLDIVRFWQTFCFLSQCGTFLFVQIFLSYSGKCIFYLRLLSIAIMPPLHIYIRMLAHQRNSSMYFLQY